MAKALNIFVAGSNRGIGLQLVKEMLDKFHVANLFATYRTEAKSKELLSLAETNKLCAIQMDIAHEKKFPEIVKLVDDKTQGTGLNLLVVNSGVSENPQTLEAITKEILLKHFEINSVGPLLLAQAFMPLLERASMANPSARLGIERAVIVNISSIMGSIGAITKGKIQPAYAYRSSKCALNLITRVLSFDLELKKVLAVAIHPGWVRTEIGGQKAPLSVEESASALVKVISNITERQNGYFLNYENAREIRW